MNTYKIEWTFTCYDGSRLRQIEIINALNAKMAIIILHSNYIFCENIRIEDVWIDSGTSWDHIDREEWEDYES